MIISFSIREHVNKIQKKIKRQTTRFNPRRQYRPGQLLQLYYRPRMKKFTCVNCINPMCQYSVSNCKKPPVKTGCECWNNLLGIATIETVEHFYFIDLSTAEKAAWSIADGFEDFNEANSWMENVYGPEWQKKRATVVRWVMEEEHN